MSDEKNDDLLALGDLDWDSALDEWEKNTFVPEVARDAETNQVAGPIDGAEPKPRSEGTPAPAAATVVTKGGVGQIGGDGTVIAPVPSELRRSEAPKRGVLPRPSAPPRAGSGGLSQLFNRPSEAPPAHEAPAPEPPPFAPPPPPDDDDEDATLARNIGVPYDFAFEVATTDSFKNAIRLAPTDVLPNNDYVVKRLLTDLPSDQDIFYRVTFADLTNAKAVSEPVVGHFRTAPASRRDVRFAWSGDTAGPSLLLRAIQASTASRGNSSLPVTRLTGISFAATMA